MSKGKGRRGGFGGGGGGNMNQLVQRAQKMQREMELLQENLGTRTVETTAGGGAVACVVNGKHEIVSLRIDPEALDPEDVESLQDVIIAAVNEANRKVTEEAESEMGKITGGMKLPGMS
ncbi:MAG: YbaB/EbfC family nucleoid-associated protein [Myxococcales bacterium]|nr:YbaB/EbfC family nucleoid-associated protein [Myxococcales bacterium]